MWISILLDTAKLPPLQNYIKLPSDPHLYPQTILKSVRLKSSVVRAEGIIIPVHIQGGVNN